MFSFFMVSNNKIERYEQWKFVSGVKLNAENWVFLLQMSHLSLTRFSFVCNTKRQRVNGKSVTLHVPDKYCKIASINVCFQLGFLLFVVVSKQGSL